MSWFKVDDGFYRNAKTAMLSDAATALWLRAATWVCDQLTDGFVPTRILPMLRGSDEAEHELVEVGLWQEVDGGYLYHDWLDYQPSAEEVEELRRKRSEAGRRGARITNGKKSASDAANARQSSGNMLGKKAANLRPVSVPVPVVTSKEVTPPVVPPSGDAPDDDASKPKKHKAVKTSLPDDWHPNAHHADVARKQGCDLVIELEKFKASAEANARTYANWDQAFNNWLLNATNFNRGKPGVYVNRAQQRFDANMRRVQAVEATHASQPQLTGGADNDFGY